VTITLDPGTTLAATDALKHRRGQTWTDEQVAYLIALAYQTGRLHGFADDLAETVETWREHVSPARITRAQRKAAREAQMRNPPAGTYMGGPVDWETGKPLRGAA
jgi:hypothetical protein